jgi:hypothetical protein
VCIARRSLKGLPSFMYLGVHRIQIAPAENFSPDTEYPKPTRGFALYVQVNVGRLDRRLFQVGHGPFLPHYFQFTIH